MDQSFSFWCILYRCGSYRVDVSCVQHVQGRRTTTTTTKRVLNHSLIKSVIYAFHSGCIPITVGVSWCSWMDVFSVFLLVFLREFLLDLMLKGSTGHTGGSHEFSIFLDVKKRWKANILVEFWIIMRTLKLF